MLRMERQLGEVDVLAGDLDLVHRRIAGRHFDQRLRIGEPGEIFVVKLVFGGLEGGGEPLAIAGGLGDQLGLLGTGFLEQHGFVGGFDDGAQLGQRHRPVVHFHLAELDQALDEVAQPVFVEVEIRAVDVGWAIARNDTSASSEKSIAAIAQPPRCLPKAAYAPPYLPQPKW